MPALLQLVGGGETVASRFTRLTVLTDSGDSVYVDDIQTFTGPNQIGRAVMPGRAITGTPSGRSRCGG